MVIPCCTCSYPGLPSHFVTDLIVDGRTRLPLRTDVLCLRRRGYRSARHHSWQLDGVETPVEMQAFRSMGLRSSTHDTLS